MIQDPLPSFSAFKDYVDGYAPLPAEEFTLHGKTMHYLYKNEKRMYSLLQALWPVTSAGDRIVDFGAYPGTLFRLLRHFCPGSALRLTAAGLMFSDAYSATMKELDVELAEVNFDPEFDGIHQTPTDPIYALPAHATPCQVVVATEILEHMVNPLHLLRVAFEALAPGGHLVLTTPNLGWLSFRLHLLRGISPNPPLEEGILSAEKDDWRPHVRLYTMAEVARLLEHVGFAVKRTEYLTMCTRDHDTLLYKLAYSAPSLRHGLLLVAQKP